MKPFVIYKKLYRHFGPQNWWPADSTFEVIIGAILTQNTSWQNVEKAILNLKNARSLNFKKMYSMNNATLARLIKPAGYYNIKAKRIKNFLKFLKQNYSGDLAKMKSIDLSVLRDQLLSVNGIGPETADSILLYALDKPVFVVDAYTKRISSLHGLTKMTDDYDTVQKFFLKHLPHDKKIFNEYHALLVRLAKDNCKKTKRDCLRCPIYEKN